MAYTITIRTRSTTHHCHCETSPTISSIAISLTAGYHLKIFVSSDIQMALDGISYTVA